MPREPRDPDVFTEATAANLKELAWAYQPIMRFADSESFFPVLAESWLTHTTSAPWDAAEAEADDLPADPGRHGTAIATADAGVSAVTRLGGSPNPDDRPIQLASGNGADDIGRYSGGEPDTFLAFGGWLPGEGFRKGNRNYDYAAFSELAAAINPRRDWRLIEGEAHLPHVWVPQPPTPTVYAEAEWAGKFTDWAEQFNQPDLPYGDSPLDDYLALTYHYLYAIREPAPDNDGPRKLEGQWEAISLFFRGRREGGIDEDGRPRRFLFQEPPRYVAYSQGLAPEQTVIHRAEVRPWSTIRYTMEEVGVDERPSVFPGVTKIGTHPVAYVGSGTHRNLFAPAPDVPWNPGDGGSEGINYDPASEFPGIEMVAAYGLAAAALGPALFAAAVGLAAAGLAGLAAILVALAVLLIIAALLLLILWVILFFQELSDQASGDPLPEWQDVDETGDVGSPQAGAGDDPPPAGAGSESAAGEPGSPGAAAMAPGVTNTGSPAGFNTVDFDLRVIDMWRSDRRTDYPAGEPTESPHWWDYTGRWGVRVQPLVGNDWQDGTRRVDRYRRSWGYWNAYWLLDFWSRPGYPAP
jgi:hypothetical protein